MKHFGNAGCGVIVVVFIKRAKMVDKGKGKQLLYFCTSFGKYSDFSDCFNFVQKGNCPNTRLSSFI